MRLLIKEEDGELKKQPQEVVCKKRFVWKFGKMHRETPVQESLFQQSCRSQPAILLKKRL